MTNVARPAFEVDQGLARAFGLSADEYAKLPEMMGRTSSLTKRGMFSVLRAAHRDLATAPPPAIRPE